MKSCQQIEFHVDPKDLPRIKRKMGIPLEQDTKVDNLGNVYPSSPANVLVLVCRMYRRLRPTSIGNRCAFEPSCSRYTELCLRHFPLSKAISMSVSRLKRCQADTGGLDIPPINK